MSQSVHLLLNDCNTFVKLVVSNSSLEWCVRFLLFSLWSRDLRAHISSSTFCGKLYRQHLVLGNQLCLVFRLVVLSEGFGLVLFTALCAFCIYCHVLSRLLKIAVGVFTSR